METFSNFLIKILKNNERQGWYYQLYNLEDNMLLATGDECFISEGVARLAAIGHIYLMEINSESGHS